MEAELEFSQMGSQSHLRILMLAVQCSVEGEVLEVGSELLVDEEGHFAAAEI